MGKNIFVTQPFLPPLEEFNEYLVKIWKSKWLTNNGQFHQQLEKELTEYLGVPYISLFSNGALALVTALQCLRVTGEVITTPFSFVATTHSLWWNNIKPVFVDIDPIFGNLNPDCIEAAITPQTTAIMPVHVYGNPCANEKIQKIADTYGLKIIYDAAHAFHVRKDGHSILNWGDLSILSFHATKVFNTFEGGAIICKDLETKKRIDDLKNFGIHDEVTVVAPGINAKMNEVQAAFGLLQLKYINSLIEKRKEIASLYRIKLHGIEGIRILDDIENVTHNYSYFPIFINKEFGITRDELYIKLKEENILSRRYFYPLISSFSMYRGLPSANLSNLPIAHKIANEVLCLPIYPDLRYTHIENICSIITKLA
ncbi:MAG: DegT/DnrJ/EryC1/StrS family aminotransferase [Bacteroidetes bacterium]|nr:DegT/DnrJ/EryC1/StrS family aminotransferase [Bacteroidota bacterium]